MRNRAFNDPMSQTLMEKINYVYPRTRKEFPEWRKGQTYFNVLNQLDPILGDEIRGTENDPFYLDERLDAFFKVIKEKRGE